MKTRYGKTALISFAAVLAIGLLPQSKIHAQGGCTLQTLNGPYAYQDNGFYGTPTGTGFFASSGVITADGLGGFTSIDTVSQNGVITRNRTQSGTYQVTPACTGSIAYIAAGQVTANVDFVLLKNGNAAKFIQSDAGTVISGTAELQGPFGR